MISRNSLLLPNHQETGHFLFYTYCLTTATFTTIDSLESTTYFSERLMRRLGQFIHKSFEASSRSVRSFSFLKNKYTQLENECGVRALINLTLFLIHGKEATSNHSFCSKKYTQNILDFKKWILYIISTENTFLLR